MSISNITGTNLARNTILNFVGQTFPLIVAFLAIPFIIRNLGTERFGILSLAWMIISYFSLFDMGLSRATTKLVAEIIASDDNNKLPAIVWTSISSLLLLGIASGLLLALLTPFLVKNFFNISAALSGEAKTTFLLLSLSIPLIVISTGLRGILEAGQHFGIVNMIFIPLNTMNFLAPIAGILLDFHLPGIVSLMVFAMLYASTACFFTCLHVYPILSKNKTFDKKLLRSLFSLSAWIAVGNFLGPIIMCLDRLIIAKLLTMSILAYYTTPYEIVTKIWVIPMSIVTTLFPAFSGIDASGNQTSVHYLFIRSLKYLIIILFPLILILVLFSETILTLWIDHQFAMHSSSVMKILAIGTFINSLGWIPATFLVALGRPDIQAKIVLFEFPIFIGLALLLIKNFGIEGAAMTWSLLMATNLLLVFWAIKRFFGLSSRFFLKKEMLKTITSLSIAALLLIIMKPFCISTIEQISVIFIFLLITIVLIWYFSLDYGERTGITASLSSFFRDNSSKQ